MEPIRDEQVKVFLGEVQNIVNQYADYNIKIWCFDTNVHNEQDYLAHDDSIENYKIAGGGGTDFMANWEYMKENGIESKSLFKSADGYTWDHGETQTIVTLCLWYMNITIKILKHLLVQRCDMMINASQN